MTSIPEQLAHITSELTRFSRSLEEIKQRWERENMENIDFRQRMGTVQEELRHAREVNIALRTQNQDLEAQLAQRTPSSDTGRRTRQTLGVYLREDVVRANARIANARDHDLISNSDIDETGHQSRGSSPQTVRDRGKRVAIRTDGVTTEDDDEAQDARDEFLLPNPTSSVSGRVRSGVGFSVLSTQTESVKGLDQSMTSISGTLPSELIPESDSFPVQPASPSTSSGGSSKIWTIQIHRPPVSARVKCGPMKWSQLSRKLDIDEDTVASLKRNLLSNASLGLSLQIQGDYVFVYNPIFLEDISTPATYLFGWGKEEDNGNTSQYLQEKGEQNGSVFHTFAYSLKPKRWYYVGAQTWTQISLGWEIWPTLGEQDRSRSKVLQHLEDHGGNRLQRDEIIELLDNRALKQICFNLSGESHIDSSREMCITMGYTPPAT